ncbi:MAG: hypothetical protein ACKVOE_01835 [Rickettsiales bacterium]
MRTLILAIATTSIVSVAYSTTAMAVETPADCGKFKNLNRTIDSGPNAAMAQDPNAMHECIWRGGDSPIGLRRNDGRSSGVKVGGSSGLGVGAVQGPERSPGANGAPFSASNSAINFALKFPPWAGFPCQLPGGINLCGGGGNGDGTGGGGNGDGTGGGTGGDGPRYGTGGPGSCPAETDTTGTFGATYALSSGALPLVCGGAIPLSTYQLTLQRNADHLASTEYGAQYLWVYKQSGSNFANTTAQPIKLPSHLCMPDSKGKMVKSVTLSGTTAQMIMYNATTKNLALRLTALDTTLNPALVDYSGPEKYLIIPISGGNPEVPADCALESTYYKAPTSFSGDIAFEDVIIPLCEGSNCDAAATTTPAGSSCDPVTVYPQGTISTTAGAIDCSTKIQIAVISRPNLLYPPGVTPQTVPISGRSGVLVQSVDGSNLYVPQNATIHLGTGAPAMVLSSGGTMNMADGGTLAMNGPATINPGNGQITLTSGGELRNAQGSLLQTFAAGNRIAPNIALPMTIHLERDMQLPAGYLLPTPPNPYVRLPINAK